MFDLRPVLAEARVGIERNLAEMHREARYILGPQTQALESQLALAFGARGAVGVSSGTAALELCLRSAGITTPDQKVLVPAMTSLFTAQAVLAAGAGLVVADVDPERLLLTRAMAEAAWTPYVRAVIAVHLYGQPCALDELSGLCGERGAVLIQDCCQAHGARYRRRALTSYSPYCAYSFYPTKNLGCVGDGGAVLSDDETVLDRLRLLRDGGRRGDQTARVPAINARLDEIQACYLRAMLPSLEKWNGHRRDLAACYAQQLNGLPGVSLVPASEESVRHLMVARSPIRDNIRAQLEARLIQTGVHYPVPVHRQPAFSENCLTPVRPVHAERAAAEVFSLPLGPHVATHDLDRVCLALREVLS